MTVAYHIHKIVLFTFSIQAKHFIIIKRKYTNLDTVNEVHGNIFNHPGNGPAVMWTDTGYYEVQNDLVIVVVHHFLNSDIDGRHRVK